MNDWLLLSEAAGRLGIDPSTLRRQIKNGAVRRDQTRRIGRFWLVSPAEVERYARDHRQQWGRPSNDELRRRANEFEEIPI